MADEKRRLHLGIQTVGMARATAKIAASVLSDMPSAHINAIVMELAERASDLIRCRPPLAPLNV